MKFKRLLTLAFLTLSGATSHGTDHCSNGNKFTLCGECGIFWSMPISGDNIEDDPCDDSGNPYNVFSGNVMRRVNDLTFWDTPGGMNLVWSRMGVSRIIDAGAPSYFGDGHQWLHNWDARLSDAGIDPNGQRLIEVRHASGYTSLFRKNTGNNTTWTPINGDWKGQDRISEKFTPTGDSAGFEVTLNTGSTLHFFKHNFGSGDFYLMEEVRDQFQNAFTLEYEANSTDKLIKITAPGGHQYFDINWGTSNGLPVITNVTASDGRTVDYTYNQITDPADASNHQALWQADYSDGTFAYYRYNWERSSYRRPLLGEARDPRVASGARIVKYQYRPLFFGMVHQEKNALDNSVLSQRVVNTATDLLELTFGNGGTRVVMPDYGLGRSLSEVSSTGASRTNTYGGWLSRNLSSTTDSNGEKTTYSWREGNFLRATRILIHEDGGKKHVKRKSYNYRGLLNYTAEAPSAGGWYLTRYIRNANGHLTQKNYPDGTTESWTRNAYGDPLTHTLRNGATQSWTYYANGQKKDHTGPAKAGETGAFQSWTYYPTGLVHIHTLPTGGTRTCEYNEVGQMTKETYDDGSFIDRDYSGTVVGSLQQRFNDPTSIERYESATDSSPDLWTNTYDAFGRKESSTDPEGHTTTLEYGDAGQGICNTCTTSPRPLKVTSAEGRVTRYFYDDAWRPLLTAHLVDGDGGGNDYECSATVFDAEGRVLHTITNIVLNNVDPATLDLGNPVALLPFVQNASWTSYTYDLRGRRKTSTVWDGGIPPSLFPFSSATGYTTTRFYDGLSNTVKVIAPGSRITEMVYSGAHSVMGQMTAQKISPDGGATTYTTSYAWINGERRTITDALNRPTTITYNGRGQTLTVTTPDNEFTESVYFSNGLLASRFDEEGREATFTYDTYGRNLTVTAPGKAPRQTVHRVYALGGVDHVIDPTGREMAYTYYDDDLTHQVTIAPGTTEAATTTYTYDGDNKRLTTTDPVGTVSSVTYDLLGRQTSSTVPGKSANPGDLLTTNYQYDTEARKVTMVYPDATTSVSIRDDLGRTISATNENSETLTYGYYQETSWMTSLTDARQNVTTWAYNDLGQMLTKTYPGTPVERDIYTYDSVQRLATHTRPSGKKATYSYDSRDRVTGIDWTGPGLYGSGEDQAFTYFIDGRPDTASNGLADCSYTYHPNGDLDTVTQAHSGGSWTTAYDHDDAGRLTDLIYPATTAGNEEVAYDYNQRGQLANVYNPSTNSALATYLRRKDGLTWRLNFESGANTRSYYDAGKRSTGRFHYKAGNGNGFLDRNSYTYDTRSRRTSQTWVGNVGDRYAYDPKGQVTGVDHGVSSPATASAPITKDHEYVYDDMGNREVFNVTTAGASSTIFSGYTSYGTANPKNQYTTIGAPSSPPAGTPSHDLDGNLTDDDQLLYIWDAWNRLREVKEKATGALIATYTYDSQGRRVSKETTPAAVQGAETVLFVYDGWNVIQEWSSATVDKAYLVWGDDLSGSKQGAGGVGGLLMRQITGGETLYYHYDANGNPARLTGAASSAGTGTYRYDAFGNVRTAAGTLAAENPWQFSTKYHDQETGFSYYGYRYYDPVTGRWPSRDPLKEIGHWVTKSPDSQMFSLVGLLLGGQVYANSYLFVGNTPLIGIDPNGEFGWILAGGGIGALVSGGIEALNGGSPGEILRAAAGGFVAGAVATATFGASAGGLAAGIGAGALGGGSGAFVTEGIDAINGDGFEVSEVIESVVAGGLGGAIPGLATNAQHLSASAKEVASVVTGILTTVADSILDAIQKDEQEELTKLVVWGTRLYPCDPEYYYDEYE